MKIEKNTVASLAYQLTIEDGVVVDRLLLMRRWITCTVTIT